MNLYILDREKEHIYSTVALLIAAPEEDQARQIAINYSRLSESVGPCGLSDSDYPEAQELLALFSNKRVNYENVRCADENSQDWLTARCLLIGQASPDTTPGVIMIDTIEP